MMIDTNQVGGASRNDLDKYPIDIEDSWQVIKSYFKLHGLVSQQISSFNRFLERSL